MAKESWPILAPGPASDLAAQKAADCGAFALRLLYQGALRVEKPAQRLLAYQAPCHLRLSQGARPALELLSAIDGVELFDLSMGCCGQGGTYGMERAGASVAEARGRLLAEALAQRPYEGVVSECEACRMALGRISGLKAWHPLEILAESLSL
jgi:glycerol-3-phosphate dehydrogenase subunit C